MKRPYFFFRGVEKKNIIFFFGKKKYAFFFCIFFSPLNKIHDQKNALNNKIVILFCTETSLQKQTKSYFFFQKYENFSNQVSE